MAIFRCNKCQKLFVKWTDNKCACGRLADMIEPTKDVVKSNPLPRRYDR